MSTNGAREGGGDVSACAAIESWRKEGGCNEVVVVWMPPATSWPFINIKVEREDEVRVGEEGTPAKVPRRSSAIATADSCRTCGFEGSNFFKVHYCCLHCFLRRTEDLVLKKAPLKLFRQPALPDENPFEVGMLLEALDPGSASFCVAASVDKVVGCRLKLHCEGFSETFDFWANAYSIDIFPPGWAAENGLKLESPVGEVGQFSWAEYSAKVGKRLAPRNIFQVVREELEEEDEEDGRNEVKVGMKLEAVDVKSHTTSVYGDDDSSSSYVHKPRALYAASVTKVMEKGRRFLVHFDQRDLTFDFWADFNSPFIRPVGFAKATGNIFTPPKSWDVSVRGEFDWAEYLKEEDGGASTALPTHLFRPLPPLRFERGMRIEAVDLRRKGMVRSAVVLDVEAHLLTVEYQSGGKKGDIVRLSELSGDLHPVGYARHTSHPINRESEEEDDKTRLIFGAAREGRGAAPKKGSFEQLSDLNTRLSNLEKKPKD